MTSTPSHEFVVLVDLYFSDDDTNYGERYSSFNYKATLNGGYIISGEIDDPYYATLQKLTRDKFKTSRTEVLQVKFRIRKSDQAQYPETATRFQIANVISLEGEGRYTNRSYIKFIAIDPPSWYLNSGNGTGEVFTGNISQVVKQVVAKYAPSVTCEISETIDSKQNKWAMLRQDPKAFIQSLMDWSPSVTAKRTNWIITVGNNGDFLSQSYIRIKEQAELESKRRAVYTFNKRGANNTIQNWTMIVNNALSLVDTQLVTQGMSAVTGQYLDVASDQRQTKVVVNDANTRNKVIARTNELQATSKPNEDINKSVYNANGVTSIKAIPEHNAGDLGIKYQDYIDGRARNFYLQLNKLLNRVKVTVLGHGEWTGTEGLGIDTVFLEWYDVDGEPYFLAGNWIIYGYEHFIESGQWRTDLYLCRSDWNATATKVPISESGI